MTPEHVLVPVEGEWLVRDGKITKVTEIYLDSPAVFPGEDWTWIVHTEEIP